MVNFQYSKVVSCFGFFLIYTLKLYKVRQGFQSFMSLLFFNLALEDGLYRNYGKMMAYSLVHGGPAPTFLHPSLYEAIVHGPDSVEPPINCVTDLELRNDLEMVIKQ